MSGVRPGDVIAGKFLVERVLGEGGMGYVVSARHLQLGQIVALKFMRDEVSTPEYRTRFMREARNTVRLKSKHVSRVLDVGAIENGAPYMVMEYLEGTDLSALLHTRGPFAVHEACEYVLQACEALAEAHGCGIVHRDLKPANLFLTRGPGGEPIVKVLDFGVSKVVELAMEQTSASGSVIPPTAFDMESAVTKATDLLGSPSYMAPEQIVSARDADSRSDIWSLGVILFRLVSGKAPFASQALGELIQQIVHGPTPNLRDYRPDLPAGLEHVVARCLEKDRERRMGDVTELARLLAPYAGPVGMPSLERIALLGPALVTGGAPRPQPSHPSLAPTAQSSGGWAPVAGPGLGSPLGAPRPSFPGGLPGGGGPPASMPPTSMSPVSMPPPSRPPASLPGQGPGVASAPSPYMPMGMPRSAMPTVPPQEPPRASDTSTASATALGIIFAGVVLAAVFAYVKRGPMPPPKAGAREVPVATASAAPPPAVPEVGPTAPLGVVTAPSAAPSTAPPAPPSVAAPPSGVAPAGRPRPRPRPSGGDDIPSTRD